MIPTIKRIWSADIDDLPKWAPDGEEVCFWLQLSIGLADSDAADGFQVCVATPAGLKSSLGRRIKPRGAASAQPIVLQKYSWPAVEAAIHERLETCAGQDWLEIQEKLRRQLDWEYEGFK
jgi:hypothetical protein